MRAQKEIEQRIEDRLIYGLVVGIVGGLVGGLVAGLAFGLITQIIASLTSNPLFSMFDLVGCFVLLVIFQGIGWSLVYYLRSKDENAKGN